MKQRMYGVLNVICLPLDDLVHAEDTRTDGLLLDFSDGTRITLSSASAALWYLKVTQTMLRNGKDMDHG